MEPDPATIASADASTKTCSPEVYIVVEDFEDFLIHGVLATVNDANNFVRSYCAALLKETFEPGPNDEISEGVMLDGSIWWHYRRSPFVNCHVRVEKWKIKAPGSVQAKD